MRRSARRLAPGSSRTTRRVPAFRRARADSPEAAERYYASWEHGPTPLQVQFARAVNQLMSLSCYEQPEMMERLGYRPAPWIEEVRHKRLTVHASDVRRQEAQVTAPDPLRPRRKDERA